MKHHGFSVVEVAGFCHTQYGRYNKLKTPIVNIEYLKQHLVPAKKAAEMSPEELQGKIVTGVFVDTERAEYTDQYKALLERVMAK